MLMIHKYTIMTTKTMDKLPTDLNRGHLNITQRMVMENKANTGDVEKSTTPMAGQSHQIMMERMMICGKLYIANLLLVTFGHK